MPGAATGSKSTKTTFVGGSVVSTSPTLIADWVAVVSVFSIWVNDSGFWPASTFWVYVVPSANVMVFPETVYSTLLSNSPWISLNI